MPDAKAQIAGLLSGQQPGQVGSLSDLGSLRPQNMGLLSSLGNYFSPSNHDWAPWPIRAARSGLSALAAPADAYAGRLPMMDDSGHTSLDAIGRATDLAGLMTLGAGAVPAETGMALNAGLSGLRQRYATVLNEASGYKDLARIKLTPERMKVAKALMEARTRAGKFGGGPSPYRATEQAQLAADFAARARQAVDDVRVKFPEGPGGSVYVRVGDNGTARFADHLPPVENGQVVGGYSPSLGRRHQPATVDVSRGKYQEGLNPTPAYEWLAKLLSGDAV